MGIIEPDYEALKALAERLEKATGPDRELDFAIARFEGWTQHTDEEDPVYFGTVSVWWAAPGEEWSTCSSPPLYTASIDAALVLVEKMLPGWGCDLIKPPACNGNSAGRTHMCDLWDAKHINYGDALRGCGPNFAIAILRAMVDAMIDQSGPKDQAR